VSAVVWPAFERVRRLFSTVSACLLLGLSRSSVYRWESATFGPKPAPARGVQPAALDLSEAGAVLAVLDDDRFADKAPEQVWAILLDEGIYLCSVSTMYRILRSHSQVRERRAQAAHPPRVIPQLVATGPNQVWSWDITKLKGPGRGVWFNAYVIMDIYSRKIIHVQVHARENQVLACDFIAAAVATNGGVAPGYIHSDNGGPMIAKTVSELLSDLSIVRSLSRPKISNDNPFSEALFKTVKYCPAFPDEFTDIGEARAFMNRFAEYYNTGHRHSGIGFYTPGSVHDGTWTIAKATRQEALNAAYTAHPERFRRGHPTAPEVPKKTWINRPTIQSSTTDPHTGNAA
jgi:putative transposase